MKNIVIVGAGLAGWATALFIKKIYPETNVTVIGSKEIGILGAGEGTVPGFKDFLNSIDIDPNDLVRNCKATLKYGIKFENWNQDGTGSYYNVFKSSNAIDTDFSNLKFKYNIIDLYCYANNLNPDDYSILNTHLNHNKVLYEQEKDQSVRQKLHRAIFHAYHFDANDIAEFLEKTAIQRNINYIDDIVAEFIQSDDGTIKTIKTNHKEIDTDFVFDCTGFKRLIIGKLLNSNFIEAKDRLLVNRSIPFILPPKDSIEPYTTARAMKYGWLWKIPLQHRYGCGYVFNDNLCSIDDAKKEIVDMFGEVEMPRTISFNAGYYDEVWKKNCIAIGLSASFVEPLEATSIWLSLSTLAHTVHFLHEFESRNQSTIDLYNKMFRESNEIIIDNIQFHYLNNRSDTEFWRTINSNKRSSKLNQMIQVWDNVIPGTIDEEKRIYVDTFLTWESSWFHIAAGIKFLKKEIAAKTLETYKKYYTHTFDASMNMKSALKVDLATSMSHADYIEHLVGSERLKQIKSSVFKI